MLLPLLSRCVGIPPTAGGTARARGGLGEQEAAAAARPPSPQARRTPSAPRPRPLLTAPARGGRDHERKGENRTG